MEVEIRPAQAGDVEVIAALHAESWRSAYRGTFSDRYLEREAPAERLRHWTHRLGSGPRPDQGVLLAMEGEVCVGFICIYLELEPAWGPVLDNLHVRPDRKGRGIGSRLIREGLGWVRAQGCFERWHLWVLERNTQARRVYEHLGWEPGERAIHVAPDGTEYASLRYTQRLGRARISPRKS